MKPTYLIIKEGRCYCATDAIRECDELTDLEFWRAQGCEAIVKVTKTDDGWKAEEV